MKTGLAIKLPLLIAILIMQGAFMWNASHRVHALQGDLYKYPVRKSFTQNTYETRNYVVVDYDEMFWPEDSLSDCGWVDQRRWFPKLGKEPENYTAFLVDGQGQTRSREFLSLVEAEQYEFSNGCPSTKWGRK